MVYTGWSVKVYLWAVTAGAECCGVSACLSPGCQCICRVHWGLSPRVSPSGRCWGLSLQQQSAVESLGVYLWAVTQGAECTGSQSEGLSLWQPQSAAHSLGVSLRVSLSMLSLPLQRAPGSSPRVSLCALEPQPAASTSRKRRSQPLRTQSSHPRQQKGWVCWRLGVPGLSCLGELSPQEQSGGREPLSPQRPAARGYGGPRPVLPRNLRAFSFIY